MKQVGADQKEFFPGLGVCMHCSQVIRVGDFHFILCQYRADGEAHAVGGLQLCASCIKQPLMLAPLMAPLPTLAP